MADPTNARLRDFDIPVIMPRIAFKELPALSEDDGSGPVTTVTCAAPVTAAATDAAVSPLVASTGVPAPVVRLGLPPERARHSALMRSVGLPFAVSSDKQMSDLEVRVVQLLAKGRKRPLGVKLLFPTGKRSAQLAVLPTPFAKSKLAMPASHRVVRVIVTVTAMDGSVGQASADFTLS